MIRLNTITRPFKFVENTIESDFLLTDHWETCHSLCRNIYAARMTLAYVLACIFQSPSTSLPSLLLWHNVKRKMTTLSIQSKKKNQIRWLNCYSVAQIKGLTWKLWLSELNNKKNKWRNEWMENQIRNFASCQNKVERTEIPMHRIYTCIAPWNSQK